VTKAEKAWDRAIREFGCIVCWLQGNYDVPAVKHHIHRNGRRVDDMHTIPLCDPGHHQYPPHGSGKIARHPTKARFEAEYGTEWELYEITKREINRPQAK
jgi:hypothetical protein